jgi:hypothetical protein
LEWLLLEWRSAANARAGAKVQRPERLSPACVVLRSFDVQVGQARDIMTDNEPKRPEPEIMPPVPNTEPQRSQPEIPADKDAPAKDSPAKGGI